MYLKNSSGEKSASLTMLIVVFVITAVWYALAMFPKLGPLTVREFSGTNALALLAPFISLYYGRKYTDDVLKKKTDSNITPST